MARCEFCGNEATLICKELFHDGTCVATMAITCDEHAWTPGGGPGHRFVEVVPYSDEDAEDIRQFIAITDPL